MELEHAVAENFAARMAEVNEKKKVTRRVPNAQLVQGWTEQAKSLTPKVYH